MTRFRLFVFRLYEQPRLRNWFYTLAFAIFVPVGFRFATLAWEFGDWFDRPLAVIAGAFIGLTSVVTLLRIWHVPPQQTIPAAAAQDTASEAPVNPLINELMAAARRRAAENLSLAMGAAALGSTHGGPARPLRRRHSS